MSIDVYVDESGIIPKCSGSEVGTNHYFIISLFFTDDPENIERAFKKSIIKIAKRNKKLMKELREKGEIKGSSVTENEKGIVYDDLKSKCGDKFEIGVIILNNETCDIKFRDNSARAFNYLLGRYFEHHFARYSRYRFVSRVSLTIDERNVATKATTELEGYLNIKFNQYEAITFSNGVHVRYTDSKNSPLVQLSDFVANTYFRAYNKKHAEAKRNICFLSEKVCKKNAFIFPVAYE